MSTGRPPGRPSKPAELKRLEGNPGKRKLPEPKNITPIQNVSIPKAPAGLGTQGKKTWNQLWGAGSAWINPESDYQIMTLLCAAVDELFIKEKALKTGEVPRVYTTPAGIMMAHPYEAALKVLRTQITAWLSELGFSPAARARMGVGENAIEDPIANYMDEVKQRRAG